VALFYPPGRLAAERRGLDRLADHPARPRLLAVDGRALILAPFDGPVADPVGAVLAAAPVERRRLEGTRRELLASLGGEVHLPRALGRVGLRRKHVDRWLDARVAVETAVGPSPGGASVGWWRTQDGGPVVLRWDRARGDGWLALDLAALAVEAGADAAARSADRARGRGAGAERGGAGLDDATLRAAHRDGATDPEAADRAFELAAVAVALREHVLGKDPRHAARVRARVEAARRPEPEAVRVWIEGPEVVDPRLWHAPGEVAPAARARWLLAHLDGLAVAGGRLRVRTEPPIRPGKRTPQREPRGQRRRRLFSRWDEGVRVDDEGLLSATPEALALRIAEGAEGVVLDGTCGVGALTIAYARQPRVRRVIAVDRDAERLAMARHNAALYGVADRIEWIAGDVLDVLDGLAERDADLLVLDPPWGGRGYDRDRVTLDDLRLDVRGALARHRGAVVLELPRSFDVSTLPGPGWRVEPLVDARGLLKMLIARRG
jgi:trimethylguanosine synthase